MAFNDFEDSFFNATPERLFLFEMGVRRWAYVAGTEGVTRLGVDYAPMAIEMAEMTQSLAEDAQIIEVRVTSEADVTSEFIAYQPTEPMRLRVSRHRASEAIRAASAGGLHQGGYVLRSS